MHILGFEKTTLLDYPGNLAATIFLGGCNLRCPFCHNADLVHNLSNDFISYDSVLSYLKKRSSILEGVCITGGEPTINKDLPNLIYDIRSIGLKVKLDTNGTNPDLLNQLITEQSIDYIAMDIKNSPDKYALTCGKSIDLTPINDSISLIMNSSIAYEFRTTVVRELHKDDSFTKIGSWINGARAYYLQSFKASDHILVPNTFSSYTKEELLHFKQIVSAYIPNVDIRGVD